jgi:uncharacterized protein YifE (UPF0438 family)
MDKIVEVLKSHSIQVQWADTERIIPECNFPELDYELQKMYNADLQEFAEWCSNNKWEYQKRSKMWVKYSRIIGETTSQLSEQWEILTGRRKP